MSSPLSLHQQKVKNMKIEKHLHIKNSVEGFEHIIQDTKNLIDGLSKQQLNMPEAPDKWSILQCLKHMSIAAQVYVVNIEKVLDRNAPGRNGDVFVSNWKGDMFTRLISPNSNGEVRRPIQTFRSMNPIEMLDMDNTLNEFIQVHSRLIELIKLSESYDITRTKVATALGPMVKLRLGDAYRFLLGHAERHMVQLKRIKKAIIQ